MKGSLSDTIVALSTPEGAGLRAIVRVSGPRAAEIVGTLFGLEERPVDRRPVGARLDLGRFSVPCTLVWFQSPRSYTREDLAELHLPSSMPLVHAALRRLLDEGARLAEPGEFTRRAFWNGRLDLLQAEGVLELVRARDEDESRAALALLGGGLSSRIDGVRGGIEKTLALLEASLDFEEGETGHIPAEELLLHAGAARRALEEAAAWEARRPSARAELDVFLWGKPNAGKSSLLNRLDPEARAITSPIAGTTRDCIVGFLREGELRFRLIDGAGNEEPRDALSAKASAIAARFRASSPFVLGVVDVTEGEIPRFLLEERIDLFVANKVDLPHRWDESKWPEKPPIVYASAKTGEGLDALRRAIVDLVRPEKGEREASRIGVGERHRAALRNALREIQSAEETLRSGHCFDAAAAHLQQALAALDEICGSSTSEDILDLIFSQFCIGK